MAGGKSRFGEHLAALARSRQPREAARARAELAGPKLPDAGANVWRWFLELHEARRIGDFGAGSIGYADVQAWAQLTGRAPRPHEIAWLMALDRVWLAKPEGVS